MGKDVGEGARRRALASAVTSWAGPALTLRRTQTGREAWLAPVSGIHVSKAGGGGRPNGRGPSGGGSGGSRPLPGPGAGEPANALGLMDGRWGPEHGIRPTGQTPRETGENPPPQGLCTDAHRFAWFGVVMGQNGIRAWAVARAMLPGMAGITTKFPCATSGAGVGVFSW